MRILVTGAAGFIGANLVLSLLEGEASVHIVGIDNMNDYYDVGLKEWRLSMVDECVARSMKGQGSWKFVKGDLVDRDFVEGVFRDFQPEVVVNLAAQAGVRYSIENPDACISSNILGFYNILEACRHSYNQGWGGVRHLVYASSSSVYGAESKVPYSTEGRTDSPVSLYAATKKADEILAHAYSKLYDIPCTGLRFFTVYGPAGRPDMAYFDFTRRLIEGEKIRIFNYGRCQRDFTYIDDVTEALRLVLDKAPERAVGEDGLPVPPYRLYNIGKGHPENLLDFVAILQEELLSAGILPSDYDFEAARELVPMQAGDVPVTFADTADFQKDFQFSPAVDLRTGLRKFVLWYRDFYLQKRK